MTLDKQTRARAITHGQVIPVTDAPIHLVLPYPPSVNHLYATVQGRRVLSAEGREFKRRVGDIALLAGVAPLSGDVILTMYIYRPLKSGDVSNRVKVVEDALQGWAYENDKQIRDLHVYRYDDKDIPRIEVWVRAVQPEPTAPVAISRPASHGRQLGRAK